MIKDIFNKIKAKVTARHVGKHPALAAPYGGDFVSHGVVTGRLTAENRDESYKKTQQGNPRPLLESHRKIMDALDIHGYGVPLSRNDLHSFTGISITSLCGRIAELVERGQVEVAGSKTDPVTQRKVTTYQLKEVR